MFSATVLLEICNALPIFHSFSKHSPSPYTVPGIWSERTGPWSRGAQSWEGMNWRDPQSCGIRSWLVRTPDSGRGSHPGQERSRFHHRHGCHPLSRAHCHPQLRQRPSGHQASHHTVPPLCRLTCWGVASVHPPVLLRPPGPAQDLVRQCLLALAVR